MLPNPLGQSTHDPRPHSSFHILIVVGLDSRFRDPQVRAERKKSHRYDVLFMFIGMGNPTTASKLHLRHTLDGVDAGESVIITIATP